HGALKDARLLADVYLELIGGRQPGLVLAAAGEGTTGTTGTTERPERPPRPHAPTMEEAAAHTRFLADLDTPIWHA
ncbi:MAG: DNA polymerase III subunit epsilon, partial [Proteobacteria bacterium]|nr:DNA polymerase III subunit epsilon [Pseudomonadota bacterium]